LVWVCLVWFGYFCVLFNDLSVSQAV